MSETEPYENRAFDRLIATLGAECPKAEPSRTAVKRSVSALSLISSLFCLSAPSGGFAQDAVGNFSDFLIDRANDNYIYLFEVRLRENPFFGAYFPNTLKTAASGDLRSLILNRSIWRESFESDMKDLLRSKLYERMGPVLRDLCGAISKIENNPETLALRSFVLSYKSAPVAEKWKAAANRLHEVCEKKPTPADDKAIQDAIQTMERDAGKALATEREKVSALAQKTEAIGAAAAAAAAAVAALAQTDTRNDVIAAAMLKALVATREATDAVTQAKAKIEAASTRGATDAAGEAALAATKAAIAVRAVVAAFQSQRVGLSASDSSNATAAAQQAADASAAVLKAISETKAALLSAAQAAVKTMDTGDVASKKQQIDEIVTRLKSSEFRQQVNAALAQKIKDLPKLAKQELTKEDLTLAEERPYRYLFSSAEDRIQFVVATLSTISEKFDAARAKCKAVRASAYTRCALALADFVDAAAYGLDELGAECSDVSLCAKDGKEDAVRFRKYAVFFAQLGDSNEKLSPALLKNVTVPPVSFGTKRRPGANRVSMSAYFALGVGHVESGSHNKKSYVSPFVPVGVEWSHGSVARRSHSIFFSALDFGTPVTQKLNGTYTGAKFSDLIAPGVFYVWGYKESPLAWGVGIERVMGGATADTWGNRFLVFWGLDLPLLIKP